MSWGTLRLASERTPYLRAGLSWAARGPIECDIRELTGARLLELIRDPIVTISVDDGGGFVPLPFVADEALTADALQLAIDALAAELPPVDAAPPADDDAILDRIARVAEAHGFDAALPHDLADWFADRLDALAVQTGERDEARAQIGRLNAELADERRETRDAASRIKTLDKEVAALRKAKPAAKPKATDPKPADDTTS